MVLQRWRREQTTEREAWGSDYADPVDADGTPYGLVFNRENGEPLDPDKTYATFVRLVRGAGLAHVKLHGLRHLNISLQLEAGVSETVICDAGRPYLSGAGPLHLRPPHRHHRPTRRRGDGSPRSTEPEERADPHPAEPDRRHEAWENGKQAASSQNAPSGQLEIHK
jgi:hypothetical protein